MISYINVFNECSRSPGDVTCDLFARVHGSSLDTSCLLQKVCVGGMMNHQTVASVRADVSSCWQRNSFTINGCSQIEIFDKLLDVDTKLTQLRGQGRSSHGHLRWNIGSQSSNVMVDLD